MDRRDGPGDSGPRASRGEVRRAAVEAAPALLVRAVVDTGHEARVWETAVGRLWRRVEALGGRELVPWGVQVVYVVAAGMTPVDFDGVRLGSLSRKARTLVVKAAVRGEPDEGVDHAVRAVLDQAVTLAEQVAARRGLIDSLDHARRIVERLVERTTRWG
jgi:hypothetical protein